MTRKPMTYREIKGYLEEHHITLEGKYLAFPWDDDKPEHVPDGIYRWMFREVRPTIRKTGRYDFPSDLDLICPHTNPLKTGRYATEPIK